LYDPFNEFFVQLNPNMPHKKLGWDMPQADMGFVGVDEFGNFGEGENSNTAYMLWEKKYIFNKEMLPAFVSEAFGKKVQALQTLPRMSGIILTCAYPALDFLNRQEYQLHPLQLS
jgi:hypothetical protein